MSRNKVKNVVVDVAWGRSTVFSEEKSEEMINQTKEQPIELSLSRIIEDYSSDSPHSPEDDDEDYDSAYTTLPYLQSSLFGSILEDTITQLRILVECNNELRIIKTRSDWNYLQMVKYGIKQPTSVDVLEGIDPHNLDSNEYKINKLDFDRKYATDVVTATYVDLSMNKSFKALEDFVHAILETDEYRVNLAEEENKNKALRRESYKQLRLQRNHIKSVIYDADVRIDDLKTQVEDAVLNSECQSRYTDNWQRARTEQHVQTIHDTEAIHSESIEYYKQRTDHEQRVHTEVELLINISINEALQKVEDWMNKYDKDMEAIDLKIQIKKNDFQNMLDKRLDLEKTIEKHDVLMKDWIHFKEEREKARLYREKMTKSAITVQAWWRGLLVRRQLGPYKVSKKKGAAPAKKK